MKLVIDIETTAFPLESLSESQQEFIFRYADQEKDEDLRSDKREEAIRYLNLYPFTAKAIVIGMLNPDDGKSVILFEGNENDAWVCEEKNIQYKPMSESEMLNLFWKCAKKAEKIITFNGRNFDIPFLMHRSAVHKIKPTRNFIGNRYDKSSHIDLLDQFTFHGISKKFNLDFYCHAFEIESPKSKGVTGMDVNQLYGAGRIKEIAIYCAEDIRATAELYSIWNDYLNL